MSTPSAQTPSPRGKQPAERRSRKELARAGAMLVLVGLVIAFALLNLKQVRVDWIIGSGRAPLIVVIVVSLLIGVVITYLAERLSRRRRPR
ncbi:MAG TPA: LapA family protein [Solirubrobacteraceae bacterium]|nr:LapA family protein [Solirubrobacteraceae bacterium]